MKFIAVPILLLLILTQTFSKWIIIADFTINREYIAEKLCINKAKPVMQCKGKCQLSKKMLSESKESEGTKAVVKEKGTDALYFEKIVTTYLGFSQSSTRRLTGYLLTLHASPVFDIFHPPS
jgi:hypothetical protein